MNPTVSPGGSLNRLQSRPPDGYRRTPPGTAANSDATPTLAGWIDEWALREVARNPLRLLDGLQLALGHDIGGVELQLLGPGTVAAWCAELADSHPIARADALALLTEALSDAVDHGIIDRNPAARVSI